MDGTALIMGLYCYRTEAWEMKYSEHSPFLFLRNVVLYKQRKES
jgi:hypothetical protein